MSRLSSSRPNAATWSSRGPNASPRSPLKPDWPKSRSATTKPWRRSRPSLIDFAARPRARTDRLRRLTQRLNRLQLRARMHADAERRRDTREKIELGGLVVKAGLREADRAFILGVLIEAAQHDRHSAAVKRWRAIGQDAFQARSTTREPDDMTPDTTPR